MFVTGNETKGFDWSENCGESVVVTVLKDEITSGGLMNEYAEAMDKGFVLDWHTSEGCVECEDSESGGVCGYSNTGKEIVCFCKDGDVRSNSCSGMLVGLFIDHLIDSAKI